MSLLEKGDKMNETEQEQLRIAAGSYPEDVLTSYAETIDFLENVNNKNTFTDSKHVYDSLQKFWYAYPNGVIAFG